MLPNPDRCKKGPDSLRARGAQLHLATQMNGKRLR
jgi:hypothetical protein